MGCSANYVDTTGGNVNPDHIHMLISVLSHLLVSKVIQYISGTLQGEFQELRKRHLEQHL
ncbi:MAG: transposase [Alphaproteobacteria bacterium]|nr:transposase [Alphaproteobacteria bacterium]